MLCISLMNRLEEAHLDQSEGRGLQLDLRRRELVQLQLLESREGQLRAKAQLYEVFRCLVFATRLSQMIRST